MTQTRDEQEALAVRFRTSVSLDEDELNLRRVPSQPGQPVTADDVAYVRLISCRRVVCGAAEFESNCFENFHLALTSCPPARPQVHAMIELAIEQCMNRTQCIAALQKNGIDATVTGIVWERLEQENPEFFELYATVERERLNNSNGMSRCSSSCSLSTVAAQDTNNRSPFASPRVTGLAGGFGLCL